MKICKYLSILFLGLLACERQEMAVVTEPLPPELVEHTLYASTPGGDEPQTRTLVSALDDNKVLWSAHERISILSGEGNYLFEGKNDAISASAGFSGLGPADLGSYIALYPYNLSASYDGTYVSTALPPYQLGKDGSFADGYLVTADDATGNSISFNHLCSGLRFMVNRGDIKAVIIRGNNGEKIAGNFRFRFASEDTPVAESGTEECVTLTPSSGSTFKAGKYYYMIILPTVFSKGFTLMADNGSQIGELRFNSSVTFSVGLFKNITGNLDERMTWTTPSSQVYYGNENSFCLRPGKTISFDVNPRKIYGTWQRSGLPASVPVPDAAQVLWGDGAISSAALADGKLTVTASGTPGSALVAIKKGSTILWSFLVWVTTSEPASIDLPSGAKLQEPLGGQLYFQWGRKDPLRAGCSYVGNQGDNGLTYSIQHPDQYINLGASTYDWFTNNTENPDDNLWGGSLGSKTVWDPCPAGWRVPSWSAFSGLPDNDGRFTDLGFLSVDAVRYSSSTVTYWTASPSGTLGYACAFVNNGGGESDYEGNIRALAAPVRCVKE